MKGAVYLRSNHIALTHTVTFLNSRAPSLLGEEILSVVGKGPPSSFLKYVNIQHVNIQHGSWC